jgi:transcriptional antiterminator NusG
MEVELDKRGFFALRTAPGREDKFMESMEKHLEKKEDHGIYSAFRPETVKGYIFVEAESLSKLVDSIREIPNNKGVIKKMLDFEEISKYFEKDSEIVIVNERDIVEIIAGPFKGDRAKVVRTVPGKDEVIVEPINMSVPVPITMTIDDVRVVEQHEEKEE